MMPLRYQAPTENRAVLVDPPTEQILDLIEVNRRRLDRADVQIGGLPLGELRHLAREEVLVAARDYLNGFGGVDARITEILRTASDRPLLLAGHQPELSHPGVWAKNFAIHGMSKRIGGVSLNLVVDNDTLKVASLRIPTFDPNEPATARLVTLPFDRFDGEQPYEARQVHDPECFRSFAGRAKPLWESWGYEPLLPRVWADIVDHPARKIGEKFAAVRRKWEHDWGCENLELPVSRLARTESFARFVRQVVSDWPRFRESYNRAVRDYRRAHRLRSRNHPVPDLGPDELPFWGPPGIAGRRHRATVADAADPARLRPRALTLTLFSRLCLGDFFIHGIGGGKYDEVTDAILRGYFSIDPPAFQVLSATLYLPLPALQTTAADVAEMERAARGMYWNPQRYVAGSDADRPENRALFDRQRILQATVPADPAGRKARYREFRAIAGHLRQFVEGRLNEQRDKALRARRELAANAVLRRRDFPWVFFPESVLRPFLQGFARS